MSMSDSLQVPPQTEWVLDLKRQPPVYSRPLVGSERWMHNGWLAFDGAGELCIGINFTSSLGIEELTVRTRRALDKFRFVCPLSACTIEEGAYPRWVYTPSADREAWLDLAFVVEQRGSSLNASDFIKDINLKRLPCIGTDGTSTFFRVYLLATSKGGDDDRKEYGLYTHSPHSMADGIPNLHALNLMCEWISGNGKDVTVVPSEEWKNLPVDVITATGGLPKEWESSGSELLHDVATQLNQMLSPAHRLPPPTRPLDMSQAPVRYNVTLSESETRAVVVQAKKLGVSISALFRAANGLAQLMLNPTPPGSDISFPQAVTTVSSERYLKPSVNPKTYFTSCVAMMPLHVPMADLLKQSSEKATLLMTAKKIQEQFDKYLSHPCLPIPMPVLAQLPLPAIDMQASPESRLPAWYCDFQNFTVLESILSTRQGDIGVSGICCGARLTTVMAVQMWTMHNKLHFQVEGAAAWGYEFLKTLLEETIRIAFLVVGSAKL